MDFYSKFAMHVRTHRKLAGITQGDLAKHIGVSRTSLANMEVGRQRIFLHQAIKMCDVLGINLEQMYSDNREPNDVISSLNKRILFLEAHIRAVQTVANKPIYNTPSRLKL